MKNRSFPVFVSIRVTLLLVLCSPALADADERVRMTGPSPAEEAVKTLTQSLETACQNRDVIGFLSHFTPRRAARIRRPMQDLFICHDVTLEVHDTLILSESDSAIVFGVRYSWHDNTASKQLIASRVTAKRVGDAWMLDAEEILSRRASPAASGSLFAPVANAPGGRIPFAGRPDWVPPGIEWVPGGCANGKCGF
jgi:hypothetical protein